MICNYPHFFLVLFVAFSAFILDCFYNRRKKGSLENIRFFLNRSQNPFQTPSEVNVSFGQFLKSSVISFLILHKDGICNFQKLSAFALCRVVSIASVGMLNITK